MFLREAQVYYSPQLVPQFRDRSIRAQEKKYEIEGCLSLPSTKHPYVTLCFYAPTLRLSFGNLK